MFWFLEIFLICLFTAIRLFCQKRWELRFRTAHFWHASGSASVSNASSSSSVSVGPQCVTSNSSTSSAWSPWRRRSTPRPSRSGNSPKASSSYWLQLTAASSGVERNWKIQMRLVTFWGGSLLWLSLVPSVDDGGSFISCLFRSCRASVISLMSLTSASNRPAKRELQRAEWSPSTNKTARMW